MGNKKNTKLVIIYEMNTAGLLKGLMMKRSGRRICYHGVSSVVLKALLKIRYVKNIFSSMIEKHVPQKYISEYEGSFFMVENLTVELTSSFYYDYGIADKWGVNLYKNHYATEWIDTVIKFLLQAKIRDFLRFYYQVKRSENDALLIVPENEIYRYVLGRKLFGDSTPLDCIFSGNRIFGILNRFALLVATVVSNTVLLLKKKYTLQNIHKNKYKVCMRAHHPKSEGLLRNDLLINGEEIRDDDVLFFKEDGKNAYGRQMTEYYNKNNYRHIGLDELRVPLRSLPLMISDYILLPLKAFMFYGLAKEWASFNALLTFSRTALIIGYERLFFYFDIGLMLLYHSAGSEMVIAPVLCARNKSKFGVYNFGSTVSLGRWAQYAFQAGDYYFTWGENIMALYAPTCEFKEVIKVGFWGKEEYSKIRSRREELKKEIAGDRATSRIISFYDIPYFHERSTFTAKHLLDFYNAAVACSVLDNVTVILKMKSTHNIYDAKYPDEMRPLFDQLWGEIKKRDNMLILDTSMYDPLHIITVSDVNVTLELSSPSTIALICGEAGIFYNVIFDYAHHSLYPKYLDRVIFDKMSRLVEAVKSHLRGEIDLRKVVDNIDLKGYDEYRDSHGIERLRQAVLERMN